MSRVPEGSGEHLAWPGTDTEKPSALRLFQGPGQSKGYLRGEAPGAPRKSKVIVISGALT